MTCIIASCFYQISNMMKKIITILVIAILVAWQGRAQERPVALVIHGGAGTILKENMTPEKEKAYREKLTEALEAGYKILDEGGESIDAVIAAIQVLEESPLFNAGRGAVFTNEGKNELDASIMDGKTLNAGAVAGVTTVKSPIMAARKVMENSPHVMLTGKGAETFAKSQGLEMVKNEYFRSEERAKQLENVLKKEKQKQKNAKSTDSGALPFDPLEHDYKYGTVGAVALDKKGNIVAGTSTGGMTNKRFGRVGDAPIIGAGTYANNATCGVSCTGHGEFFIRSVVAYDVSALMEYKGLDLKAATNEVVHKKLKTLGGSGGLIALDNQGNVMMPFNTPGMYRGYIKKGGEAKVFFYEGEEE